MYTVGSNIKVTQYHDNEFVPPLIKHLLCAIHFTKCFPGIAFNPWSTCTTRVQSWPYSTDEETDSRVG